MPANKVIYPCNFVSDHEKGTFYFADSTLKKIRGFKRLLRKGDIEVTVLSFAAPKKSFFSQCMHQKRDVPNSVYYVFRSIFEVRRVIRHMMYLCRERKTFDVVMTYSYTAQCVIMCCFAHYLLGKTIVLDYEDGLFTHRTRGTYYSLLEKVILNVSRGCILVNEGLRRRLRPRNRYEVINGIFPSEKPVRPSSTKKASHKRSVLYSGELSFDYGLSLMFDVFLSPNAEKIDFHITGSGVDEAALVDFIERENLEHVSFHGYIPLGDLRSLEDRVDGFILCQNEDSPIYDTNFPSKLFHFLSFGKAVFLNRCTLFAKYQGFENAFFIDNVQNGANQMLNTLTNGKKYYPEVQSNMEAHNQESLRKLKKMLVGDI